jgi:transcriptional regulator with XRE-family HTH domain
MINTFYSYSDKELIRKWAEKLKAFHLEADISQTDLAEKIGMSSSSIAEIEKGINFSISSLISIARALNFLDEFELFFKSKEYKLSPMEIYELEQNKKKRGGYNK